MSHFAKVHNGIVTQVLVAEQDFIDNHTTGTWVQTSYNTHGGIHYAPNSNTPDGGTPLRFNFAGIGYTYDLGREAFYPPRPFPSWSLNELTCLWEPPVSMPDDGKHYWWQEAEEPNEKGDPHGEWVEITAYSNAP